MYDDAPETAVDLVVSLLISLAVSAAAFPLGIVAATLHVTSTLLRNIPTCVALGVACIVLTSAVVVASVGYAVFWSGLIGLRALVACKKAVEDSATMGTNMASIFLDEWARERGGIEDRWSTSRA